jgi:hypothetical protein
MTTFERRNALVCLLADLDQRAATSAEFADAPDLTFAMRSFAKEQLAQLRTAMLRTESRLAALSDQEQESHSKKLDR